MSGTTGRWEYHIEHLPGKPEVDRLNALGLDRWELAGVVDQQTLIFKRPTPTLAEQITLDQRTRVEGETRDARGHEQAGASGS